MGKRKKSSRKPTGPKKREPLETSFRCAFCNHEKSVSVKIDKKQGVASLSCKSCGQSFQTSTNYLTQPVDVYADWIDACEDVAKGNEPAAATHPPPSQRQRQASYNASSRAGLAPGEKYTEEDLAFVEDDEADLEAEYGD